MPDFREYKAMSEEDKTYLQHYGVLGMHWGKRKAKLESRRDSKLRVNDKMRKIDDADWTGAEGGIRTKKGKEILSAQEVKEIREAQDKGYQERGEKIAKKFDKKIEKGSAKADKDWDSDMAKKKKIANAVRAASSLDGFNEKATAEYHKMSKTGKTDVQINNDFQRICIKLLNERLSGGHVANATNPSGTKIVQVKEEEVNGVVGIRPYVVHK